MSTSEDTLDKITNVLIIDILPHAIMLEERLQQTLIDYEPGIYIPGGIKPYLSLSKPLFFEKDRDIVRDTILSNGDIEYLVIKSAKDILSRRESVIDSTGEVVMYSTFIKNKHKLMSIKPTIPARAVEMAMSVALNHLTWATRCTRMNFFKTPLHNLVKPEYRDLVDNEEYPTAFDDIIVEVSNFIGQDTWHVYFHKIQGTCLIIEKTCDFRIMEYYRLKEEIDNIKNNKSYGDII